MLNNIIFENKGKFLAIQKCYKILEITYTIHTSSFLRLLRLEDTLTYKKVGTTPSSIFLLAASSVQNCKYAILL